MVSIYYMKKGVMARGVDETGEELRRYEKNIVYIIKNKTSEMMQMIGPLYARLRDKSISKAEKDALISELDTLLKLRKENCQQKVAKASLSAKTRDLSCSACQVTAFTIGNGLAYTITNVTSDGTTVTYTAQNNLVAGDVISVIGVNSVAPDVFNLSLVTVDSSSATYFTILSAAVGVYTSGGQAITAASIANSDGSYGPFVIAAPGNYVLQNSPQMAITGAQGSAPNAAIVIESSDVHLDLCGQVLTGSGNLTAPLSPSPKVVGGLENDIRVDASTGIIIGPNNDTLDNVSVSNGKIQYFSENAVNALFNSNLKLVNLDIEHCYNVIAPYFNTTPFPGAIVMFEATNLVVDNCRFLSNRFSEFQVYRLDNCSFTNIKSTGLRGGAYYTGDDQQWLADAEFVEYGTWCVAFDSFYTNRVVLFENFNVSDVKSLAIAAGHFTTGGGGGLNAAITYRNCIVADIGIVAEDTSRFIYSNGGEFPNFTYDYEVRGFWSEFNNSITYENCTASSIFSKLKKFYFIPRDVPNAVAGFWQYAFNSVVMTNCTASNVTSAGLITRQVPNKSNLLVVANQAVGFFDEIDRSQPIGGTIVYQNCSASNIDASVGSFEGMESSAVGFYKCVNQYFYQGFFYKQDMSSVYRNCSAEHICGSDQSAGFSVHQRELSVNASKARVAWPIIYEDCTAQFDRVNFQNAKSSGFLIDGRGNNIVFKRCIATGHSLDGFNLSGLVVDILPGELGFAKMILEDCIANANTRHGFKLDSDIKQVEVINCKATNNGADGINVAGRDVVLRSCVADLNGANGFDIEPYFPFHAKVATDTDLSNLPIYAAEGGYTVKYYPDSNNDGAFQYMLLVPNDPAAPLPLSLLINGVQVNSGDVVLVKDETNGLLDGVYVATNTSGFVAPTLVTITPPPSTSYSAAPAGSFRIHFKDSILPAALQGNNMSLFYFTYCGTYTGPYPTGAVNNLAPPPGNVMAPFNGGGNDSFGPWWEFPLSPYLDNPCNGAVDIGMVLLTTDTLVQLSGNINVYPSIGNVIKLAGQGDVFIYFTDQIVVAPCWQLERVDSWRAPNTIMAGTKVLVAESNTPNLTPGPVMYTVLNDTRVDIDVPTFSASQLIYPGKSRVIVDSCKASINKGDGCHNSAVDVTVSNTECSRNEGHGFLDDSANGAKLNGNMYARNNAYINDQSNYAVDYVIPTNKTVLKVGSINPPVYPCQTGIANISVVLQGTPATHCHKRHHCK